MNITIPYYEDRTRISNSNIGWFLNKGPAFLHKMLTEDMPDEKSKALERGTMIHEYLLQPEEFQKDYVIWDKSRPTSVQQEKFCQVLAFSTEIEPNRAVLSAYKDAYSTRGKSDDLMLSEGLKIASTLKDYIDFLKEDSGRTLITHYDWKMLETIKRNVNKHKLAKLLVWPNKTDVECHHEFHINWEWQGFITNTGSKPSELKTVQCKSLLDSIVFDYKTKTCTIMDLKTTQKLWHFEDSMTMYDYTRQLAYYKEAASWYLTFEKNENIQEWIFEFYIIGIDTTGSYDIRVFKFNIEDLYSSFDKINSAMFDIAWHIENNKWEHSRAYYEGDGAESLNL